MSGKSEFEFESLSTILDVKITKWNEVSVCECSENSSPNYLYCTGLSINLHVWMDNSRLKFSIQRRNVSTSNSIHCKLCLIGQLKQELFTECKTVTFPEYCTNVLFTEWCMEGVKKVVPKEDHLIIRCTFSVVSGNDASGYSIRTEAPLLNENKQPSWSPDARDLSCDFDTLLRSGILSDVILEVGQESFPAHRLILTARSKVFAAMLEHNMEEKNSGSVSIDDIETSVFKLLLQYIYTGDVPEIPSESIYKLYAAADKYAIFGLKKMCASRMLNDLSQDNTCEYLDVADRHADGFLKHGVIDYMMIHDNIFLSGTWKEFCKANPVLAIEAYNKFVTIKLTDCPLKRKKPNDK